MGSRTETECLQNVLHVPAFVRAEKPRSGKYKRFDLKLRLSINENIFNNFSEILKL